MSATAKLGLIKALEECAAQTLDEDAGRSNVKTSILHGAFDAYFKAVHAERPRWEHEVEIKGSDQTFKIDMMCEGRNKSAAVLLKMPMRGLSKNKKNMLVHTWGEAIRVALIRRQSNKPLYVLSLAIHPTIDINIKRGGRELTTKDFKPDSNLIYQMGYDFIQSPMSKHRHMALPFEFNVPPTLKTLKGVHSAFTSISIGHRITISRTTWIELDRSIRWLLDGLN